MHTVQSSDGTAIGYDLKGTGPAVPKVAVYEAPVIVNQGRPPLPADYLTTLTGLASTGRRGQTARRRWRTCCRTPGGRPWTARSMPWIRRCWRRPCTSSSPAEPPA